MKMLRFNTTPLISSGGRLGGGLMLGESWWTDPTRLPVRVILPSAYMDGTGADSPVPTLSPVVAGWRLDLALGVGAAAMIGNQPWDLDLPDPGMRATSWPGADEEGYADVYPAHVAHAQGVVRDIADGRYTSQNFDGPTVDPGAVDAFAPGFYTWVNPDYAAYLPGWTTGGDAETVSGPTTLDRNKVWQITPSAEVFDAIVAGSLLLDAYVGNTHPTSGTPAPKVWDASLLTVAFLLDLPGDNLAAGKTPITGDQSSKVSYTPPRGEW